MDMTASIIPKSDQLNADDLISGPVTVTVDSVIAGNAEQPVDVHLVEFPGRAFRPSKSMRRVMVAAWGAETSAYTGRRMTLYRDPSIKFGKDEVGGIRISHMSDIDKTLKIALTVTRGKREPFVVAALADAPRAQAAPSTIPLEVRIGSMIDAFAGKGIGAAELEARIGRPRDEWTADDVAAMTEVYKSLRDEA